MRQLTAQCQDLQHIKIGNRTCVSGGGCSGAGGGCMPMLASAEGDVSAAKAALKARAIAGLEARAAGVAPDEDSPCMTPSLQHAITLSSDWRGVAVQLEPFHPCARPPYKDECSLRQL